MKNKLKLTMSYACNYVLTIITILLSDMDKIASDNIIEMPENEESLKLSQVLPVTEEQLQFLAMEVCGYLEVNQEEYDYFESFDKEICETKFMSEKRTLSPRPGSVNFTCRTQREAKLSIAPSKYWQLAALVPEDRLAYINIAILKPLQKSGTISVENTLNHTLWTTVLHGDGSPSIWLQGPRLPTWREGKKLLNVTIEDPMLEINKTRNSVNADFEVLFFGEVDACSSFDIVNTCEKMPLGYIFQKTVTPISNQTITIKGLLKNDNCCISIYIGNDVYRKKYPTIATLVVEEPKGVALEPVPKEGNTWDIYVKWEKPKVDTEYYNVTLRAPGVFRTDIIIGNLTSWVFEDVEAIAGTGNMKTHFNVSIQSFAGNVKSTFAFARAAFPERKDYRPVIVTGSWSIVLTVAAAAIGCIIWWRRRRALALRHLYFTYDTDLLPKECLDATEPGVEDAWELRSERLLLHEVIGEGEFGVVRRGTLAPGGKDVAVKMLKDFPTAEEVRSFRAEMELMKSVGAHPHIVNLVGCCSGRRPLIVAEYCSRGDLLSFLRCSWDVMVSKSNAKYYNNNIETSDYRNDLFKKQNETQTQKQHKLSSLVVNRLYDLQGICDTELTSRDLLSFCRQIAMGMEFLASNRLVHRDLAARNILVTADRTLKITDFGLSRDVYQENHYKQKGNGKLPVKWMALESLTRGIYTSQSDVWSFGVVVWETVTVGAPPYASVPAARLPRLLRAGYRMPRPNNCSKQLYEMMLSCWQARPRDRPTFSELHRALDDLLNCACADEYLTLELDYEPPPTPKSHRYIKMLLRGNRVWAKGESYERPLKAKHYTSPSNYYTSPPAPLAKVQLV